MDIRKKLTHLFLFFSMMLTLLSPLHAKDSEVYLFGTTTCFECAKVKEYLREQQIAYIFIDIETSDGLSYYNQVLTHYDINNAPSPMLLNGSLIYAGYEDIINEVPYVSASSITPNWMLICLAGLVDGINPCAMSLLLFILTLCFKYKLHLFKAMTLYILGIFSANYLIGMLLIQGFSMFSNVAKYLYIFVILTSLIFLILSCFSKLDVTLGFSHLKRLLDKKPFYTTIFLSAFLVAILEFFCTSQVYLPSTLYIATLPNWYLFLFLYNINFVLPLIFLINCTIYFYNANALKVNLFISQNQRVIKLMSNIILVLLILILILQYRRLF